MSYWQLKENKLEKNFTFVNFKEAIGFINKVAEIAESVNHHPDIQLYNYKNVKIVLFTHSKQQVTDKDHALAAKIGALVN